MIRPVDYEFLTRLLLHRSGLALGPDKGYLLESRLLPLAERRGLGGLAGLVQRLRGPGSSELAREVCEAMTTNESLFFRDITPFTVLRERLLPELIAARRAARSLRIWCAAASTGQEPYSVAMILHELREQLAGWQLEILATDYSRPALERARAGVYNHFEVQRGLPIQMLTRHFDQVGCHWRVRDHLRPLVRFRDGNLLEPFARLGTFDLVFCRNVLIYFNLPTKRDVLDRLVDALRPDGYLFLGGSESTMGITDRWERVLDADTSLYRPQGALAALRAEC